MATYTKALKMTFDPKAVTKALIDERLRTPVERVFDILRENTGIYAYQR
jgi:hypothetical protein